MIEYQGENYISATEVARRFKVSRGTCNNNILTHVQACYLPGRKKPMYQLLEVEALSEVRIVACQQSVSHRQVSITPCLAH